MTAALTSAGAAPGVHRPARRAVAGQAVHLKKRITTVLPGTLSLVIGAATRSPPRPNRGRRAARCCRLPPRQAPPCGSARNRRSPVRGDDGVIPVDGVLDARHHRLLAVVPDARELWYANRGSAACGPPAFAHASKLEAAALPRALAPRPLSPVPASAPIAARATSSSLRGAAGPAVTHRWQKPRMSLALYIMSAAISMRRMVYISSYL